MYATIENYIVPLDGFLEKPAPQASLYEYLLACRDRIAARAGDYTAFVTPAGDAFAATPMSALLRDVERLAAFLHAQGLRPGDAVTAALPTCGHVAALLLAAGKLGLVFHPVPSDVSPEELLAALRRAESRCLFLLDEDAARLAPAMAHTPTVVCRLSDYGAPAAAPAALPDAPFTLYADALAQDLPPAKMVCGRGEADAVLLQSDRDPDRLIRLSARAINTQAYQYYLTDMPHDTRKDHALMLLPCCGGLGLAALFYELCSGFQPILLPRFSAERANEVIARRRVVEIRGVPAVFRALFAAPNFPGDGLCHLRLLFCVGGGLGVEEIRRFDETLAAHGSVARLCCAYGRPEAVAAVTSCCWQHFKPGTVGFPLAGAEVQIWDEAGNELPAGEVGEIVLGGETRMNGYRPDGADDSRLLRTGDRGYIDSEGYLHLEG